MPRSHASDPLRSFRFQAYIVRSATGYQGSLNSPGINAEAGFKSVTGGEITSDTAQYREGTDTWTKKYPGPPQTSSITLARGMIIRETDFMAWVLAAAEGREPYVDLAVAMLPREAWARASSSPAANTTGLPDGWQDASRIVLYHDAFVTRYKLPDLDSSTSDVANQEIEVEYTYFDLIDPSAAAA